MSETQPLIEFIKHNGIVRPREVEAHGFSRRTLQRLHKRGEVERLGRGLYAIPDALMSEHSSLAEVSKRVSNGVISLLSALQFYNITTQLPYQVWIAIEGTSWQPQFDYPPVEIVRMSGDSFSYGIETHDITGVPVQMYSIAKTVADCFKFRSRVGKDVALEALKETLKNKRATVDEIWEAAKVDRVSTIMKPYIEGFLV